MKKLSFTKHRGIVETIDSTIAELQTCMDLVGTPDHPQAVRLKTAMTNLEVAAGELDELANDDDHTKHSARADELRRDIGRVLHLVNSGFEPEHEQVVAGVTEIVDKFA